MLPTSLSEGGGHKALSPQVPKWRSPVGEGPAMTSDGQCTTGPQLAPDLLISEVCTWPSIGLTHGRAVGFLTKNNEKGQCSPCKQRTPGTWGEPWNSVTADHRLCTSFDRNSPEQADLCGWKAEAGLLGLEASGRVRGRQAGKRWGQESRAPLPGA